MRKRSQKIRKFINNKVDENIKFQTETKNDDNIYLDINEGYLYNSYTNNQFKKIEKQTRKHYHYKDIK